MVEYVAHRLRQTSREAAVLLYSPQMDPHQQTMAGTVHWVFCFYQEDKDPPRDRA